MLYQSFRIPMKDSLLFIPKKRNPTNPKNTPDFVVENRTFFGDAVFSYMICCCQSIKSFLKHRFISHCNIGSN